MINPKVITTDLVEILRSIPAIVRLMGNDEGNIYAYDSTYPIGVSFNKALQELHSPGILVRYRSPGPPSLGGKWGHSLTLYIRPQAGSSHETLLNELMNGIPTGQPLAFEDCYINNDLDPMRFTFSEPTEDLEGVEYLEINIDTDER